jgi:hypothetical protein
MINVETRRLAVTFIVRLWTEQAGDEASQWRGQVEHVQSERAQYFRELDQMVAFITGYLKEHKGGGG